jgi:hypothetical protein
MDEARLFVPCGLICLIYGHLLGVRASQKGKVFYRKAGGKTCVKTMTLA